MMVCHIRIEGISDRFAGWDPELHVYFNVKSTLSQLGVNGVGRELCFDRESRRCSLVVDFRAVSHLGVLTLDHITVNTRVGKLFCREPARRVQDKDYLSRLVGRVDRMGMPLLSLGVEGADWWPEKRDGRVIFHIKLRQGCVRYDGDVAGIIPSVGRALKHGRACKQILRLHQKHNHDRSRVAVPNDMLMVRTPPLYIRNCYARVASDLLPEGVHSCSSDIMEPVVDYSGACEEEEGRTFCFFGESLPQQYLTSIPLELYQLEAWREHLYFEDGLKQALEDAEVVFKAFSLMPEIDEQCCCYIVKREQLQYLRESDWVMTNPVKHDYPGITRPEEQREYVRMYIRQQCSYGILKAISVGDITSHGVLFAKYLPSPVLKNLLLSDTVSACLKRIYFISCSQTSGSFLSQEDRSLLYDLSLFGVEVLNVDMDVKRIFKYVHKKGRDHGAFVPIYPDNLVDDYLNATAFGVYGSNLLEGNLEGELDTLLKGMLAMRADFNLPLMRKDKPFALVTGGGPGAMEVGNRVAKKCGILSCGNICDFTPKDGTVVNEQKRNPFVDVWMTYKLEKLVERQSDFQLDFPIILTGGIGTDFEYALEEVRRKVGTTPAQPVVLFGTEEYWTDKVTSRYTRNKLEGVIRGSEWVSNCFFAVQTANQALAVYRNWFAGTLLTGKHGPVFDLGFCLVPKDVSNWTGAVTK